jgi:hypothetical protein
VRHNCTMVSVRAADLSVVSFVSFFLQPQIPRLGARTSITTGDFLGCAVQDGNSAIATRPYPGPNVVHLNVNTTLSKHKKHWKSTVSHSICAPASTRCNAHIGDLEFEQALGAKLYVEETVASLRQPINRTITIFFNYNRTRKFESRYSLLNTISPIPT